MIRGLQRSIVVDTVPWRHGQKNSSDTKTKQAATDTQHQALSKGVAPRSPISVMPISAMVFKHPKYANAAKDCRWFMMEANQYSLGLSTAQGIG